MVAAPPGTAPSLMVEDSLPSAVRKEKKTRLRELLPSRTVRLRVELKYNRLYH